MTGAVLFTGFMIETLFLDDWPWWAWGIGALLCLAGLAVLKWHVRRSRPEAAPVEESKSIHHFTKTEALARIERELPVYWRIPGIKRVNAKATRKEAEQLLRVFEAEHPLEVDDEYGYDKIGLGARIGVERVDWRGKR